MFLLLATTAIMSLGVLGDGISSKRRFAVVDKVVLNTIYDRKKDRFVDETTVTHELILYRWYPKKNGDASVSNGYHIADVFKIDDLESLMIRKRGLRTEIVWYEWNPGCYCCDQPGHSLRFSVDTCSFQHIESSNKLTRLEELTYWQRKSYFSSPR